jgi:hypothetical protein
MKKFPRSAARVVENYLPKPDPARAEREARLRRVTRLRNLIIRDLGNDPSAAQATLAANAAVLAIWLQDHGEKLLRGGLVDTKEYVNVNNACQRTLTALGIERKPRDVMTIDAYLKDKIDDSADDAAKDADRS